MTIYFGSISRTENLSRIATTEFWLGLSPLVRSIPKDHYELVIKSRDSRTGRNKRRPKHPLCQHF